MKKEITREDIIKALEEKEVPEKKKEKTDVAKDIADAFLDENQKNGIFEHNNTIYVRFIDPDTQRLRLIRPRTNEFKRYLARLHFRVKNYTVTTRMIEKIILHVTSLQAKQVELNLRVGRRGEDLYFNLSNDKGEVVRISKSGWSIVVPRDPMFMDSDTHIEGFRPEEPEDMIEGFNELWKHINYDKTFPLLHKITFLFSFCAIFPQPISVIHGEHGSAKSYFTKTWQKFVDPSLGDNHPLSKDKELAHVLGTGWFVSFDNVSGITGKQSDMLCQASTGGTVAKRKLYTDGETFSQDLRSVVVLNGINVSPNQPDLMRRCVLFNFKHIGTKKRRTETELQTTIGAIGPSVMGSIFSIISKAMTLVEKYRDVEDKPIMADFDTWGRALTEALGEQPEDFVQEYSRNRWIQSMRITENDDFGTILFEYLEAQKFEDGLFIIPKDELLLEIERTVSESQPNLKFDKFFPKTTIAIVRKMERLRPTLRELGFEYTEERRQIHGKRVRSFVFFVPKFPSLESFSTQNTLPKE